MKRAIFVVYALLAYAVFLGVFLYLIGFLGNFLVPKSIDTGLTQSLPVALAINSVLILAFGLQHVIMARPGFKQWWTQFIPQPIERSTYVHLSNLMLVLLFWQWRPVTSVVWDAGEGTLATVLWVLFASGWLLVLVTSFLINHFDLFGLRQVYLYLTGKPYSHVPFKTVGFYKYIRHPLMLGWIIGFWSAPVMTVGHLSFAALMTLYILLSLPVEEKDLSNFLGEEYEQYRQKTPLLVPFLKFKSKA